MAAKPADASHVEGQLSFLADDPVVDAVRAVSNPPRPEPEPGDATVINGPNTRLRAGNAMHRAREGVIRGALETIARRGIRRLTMAEAADRGGVARATLYNHARDKSALLDLVLEHEIQRLAAQFVGAPSLEQALTEVADAVAVHPALAGIREHDTAALARLATASHVRVRELAAGAMQARGLQVTEAALDLSLRWLASFVSVPSDGQSRRLQAGAMAKTLS